MVGHSIEKCRVGDKTNGRNGRHRKKSWEYHTVDDAEGDGPLLSSFLLLNYRFIRQFILNT